MQTMTDTRTQRDSIYSVIGDAGALTHEQIVALLGDGDRCGKRWIRHQEAAGYLYRDEFGTYGTSCPWPHVGFLSARTSAVPDDAEDHHGGERPMLQQLTAAGMPVDDNAGHWNERMAATIGQSIPMRISEVSKDRVVITMDVTPRAHQPSGIMHGGVSLVLAESAASIGGSRNVPPDMTAVGQEINANHLRAKRDGTLTATAIPVHIGGRSQVWSVDIRDDAGKLICISRCTLAVVPARPPVRGNGVSGARP